MKNLRVSVVVILIFAALLSLPSTLQAAWVGNDGEEGIKAPLGSESQAESFIIDGASYFLQSQADIFLLLNESEIGLKHGFNLEQAMLLVDSAMTKLQLSMENYRQAHKLFEATVINEEWKQKLKTFDYAQLTAERHLYKEVMMRVAAFLGKGNVTGLYRQMVNHLGKISRTLGKLQKIIREGNLPGMESLRTLYQQYTDFMLAGYYTSLVFSEVKTL
jgi:hypothetical protein